MFRTTLTRRRLRSLREPLSALLNGARWTVDWNDCDHVLRVEADARLTPAIERYLQAEGIECEELM